MWRITSPQNQLRSRASVISWITCPYAPFVDKVEDYVSSREDVEPTLRSFQEMIAYVVRSLSWGGGLVGGAIEDYVVR